MTSLQPLRVVSHYTLPVGQGERTSNIAALLEDVLLFDHVVVDSSRLLEFRELVKALDYGAVTELVKSGCLTVHCDLITVGTNTRHHVPPQPGASLPPNSFALAGVLVPNEAHDQYVSESMAEIPEDLSRVGKRFIKLKGAIAGCLSHVPRDDYRTFLVAETVHDIVHNPSLVAFAVSTHLRRFRRVDIDPDAILIRIEQLEDGVFTVDSNLADHGIDGALALDTTRSAALAIATRNHRIADMRFHDAVSGFHPDDLPLFDQKIAFLEASVAPERQRTNLRRVTEIGNLPSFAQLIDARQLRIDRLLALRESAPCQEFRKWLASSGDVPDEVVKDMCSSAKAKLGSLATGLVGRTLRFLLTKFVGALPHGPFLSPAVSVGDKFLTDRVLKTPGPVTFLSSSYPSLYKLGPL